MQVLGEVAITTEKYRHDFSTLNRTMVLSILPRQTKVDTNILTMLVYMQFGCNSYPGTSNEMFSLWEYDLIDRDH